MSLYCPLKLEGRGKRRGFNPSGLRPPPLKQGRNFIAYHLPLFEDTPPNLGGEFKKWVNCYIITFIYGANIAHFWQTYKYVAVNLN